MRPVPAGVWVWLLGTGMMVIALVAHVALVFALFDRDWRWRWAGIVCSILICVMAKSRTSAVAIPLILILIPILSQLYRPVMIGALGITTVTSTFLFAIVKSAVEEATSTFRNARADSSLVRERLQSIAFQRWRAEAPIFGHGQVEKGSHYVEFMPIGSHHTWFGLLFIKGAVGFLALAVPMAWTFAEVLIKAQRDPVARAALGVVLAFMINSFGENLEILSYLLWPGLLLIGIAFSRRRVGIWSPTLGLER